MGIKNIQGDLLVNGNLQVNGAKVSTEYSGGLKYSVRNNDDGTIKHYECIGLGSCTDETLIIPSEIDGIEVAINKGAFYKSLQIKRAIISEGITRLSYSHDWDLMATGAFENCSNLEYVELPNSLLSIQMCCFVNCTSLTSIIIPKSVTFIASKVFKGCTNLTIYCEADTQPDGWATNWNPDNCPVVWGYISDIAGINEALKNIPSINESGALEIPDGITSEGCTAYAKAGSAIGINTYSGSKSFTIWGLGDPAATDSNEGVYLVDGISMTAEDGTVYEMAVGDDYSCHVCYTNANGNSSRQRSFYGKITAIEETEQTAPNGDKLYAISVSPFWGVPSNATFRPFVTNEDGSISDLEDEYLDSYGVDQERNTFRIPSKPLLGYRTLGAYAYSTGYNSSANTRGAFTFGRSNIADGNYAGAIGFGNEAAYAAFATGNSTKAIGIKSFTQGANTEAYQEAASAMGVRTKVDGFGAHGTGVDVTVTGRGAQGEGISNKVSGNAAHGEGQSVEVDGVAAHGEGDNTNAIGPATHSEGKNTIAGMKWTKISDIVDGVVGSETVITLDIPNPTKASMTFTLSKPLTEDLKVYIRYNYSAEDPSDGLVGGSPRDPLELTIPANTSSYSYVLHQGYDEYTNVYADFDSAIVGNYVRVDYAKIKAEIVESRPAQFILDINDSNQIATLAPNDVYSILQTNFDTSYIDVGTITAIENNKIFVDTLPTWKDANGTKVVRYFGVRKKPTIGAQTLGEAIHAEGRATNALYSGAHAGGIDAVASSINTFAHGAVAKATSRHAIALGDHATANGAFSTAIGQYTKTEKSHQVAVGKYNNPLDPVVPDGEKPKTPLFMIGNGTSDANRVNAFVVTTDNKAYVGGKELLTTDTNTTYDLYASKNSSDGNVTIQLDPSTGTNDNVKIKGAGSTTVTTDASGVITINSTDTNTTYDLATTSVNGLMSKEDKSYVDQVRTNIGDYKIATDVPAGAKFTDTKDYNSLDNKPPVDKGIANRTVQAGNSTASIKWTKIVSYSTTIKTITLAKAVTGLAVGDTYSVLQYNYDNSYIDAGKISAISADNKTITVTALPSFGDEKKENGASVVARYFGVRTKKTVGDSAAFGTESKGGIGAFAAGNGTCALGDASFASGQNSVSSSSFTFAHGAAAKATARHAVALGDNANAAMQFSTAIGQYTKTNKANQTALGKYNNTSDALIVVGDGTSNTSRSNAFEIFGKSGSTEAYATIGGKKVVTEDKLLSNTAANFIAAQALVSKCKLPESIDGIKAVRAWEDLGDAGPAFASKVNSLVQVDVSGWGRVDIEGEQGHNGLLIDFEVFNYSDYKVILLVGFHTVADDGAGLINGYHTMTVQVAPHTERAAFDTTAPLPEGQLADARLSSYEIQGFLFIPENF